MGFVHKTCGRCYERWDECRCVPYTEEQLEELRKWREERDREQRKRWAEGKHAEPISMDAFDAFLREWYPKKR